MRQVPRRNSWLPPARSSPRRCRDSPSSRPPTIPRIGFLGAANADGMGPPRSMRSGRDCATWVTSRAGTSLIEYRFAEGQYDRLPALAAELVRLKVDVIVTHSAPGALAAKQATATNPIPVVMTNVGDPVGSASSRASRVPAATSPATRFSSPSSRRNGSKCSRMRSRACAGWRSSSNPDSAANGASTSQAMEIAAKNLNVALLMFDARGPADLDGAFAAMAKEGSTRSR